jgi:hypothetical protein
MTFFALMFVGRQDSPVIEQDSPVIGCLATSRDRGEILSFSQ